MRTREVNVSVLKFTSPTTSKRPNATSPLALMWRMSPVWSVVRSIVDSPMARSKIRAPVMRSVLRRSVGLAARGS